VVRDVQEVQRLPGAAVPGTSRPAYGARHPGHTARVHDENTLHEASGQRYQQFEDYHNKWADSSKNVYVRPMSGLE